MKKMLILMAVDRLIGYMTNILMSLRHLTTTRMQMDSHALLIVHKVLLTHKTWCMSWTISCMGSFVSARKSRYPNSTRLQSPTAWILCRSMLMIVIVHLGGNLILLKLTFTIMERLYNLSRCWTISLSMPIQSNRGYLGQVTCLI